MDQQEFEMNLKPLPNLYTGEPEPVLEVETVNTYEPVPPYEPSHTYEVKADMPTLFVITEGTVIDGAALKPGDRVALVDFDRLPHDDEEGHTPIFDEVEKFFSDAMEVTQLAIDGKQQYALLTREIADGELMGGKTLYLDFKVSVRD